jgi:hypothetical protein
LADIGRIRIEVVVGMVGYVQQAPRWYPHGPALMGLSSVPCLLTSFAN